MIQSVNPLWNGQIGSNSITAAVYLCHVKFTVADLQYCQIDGTKDVCEELNY